MSEDLKGPVTEGSVIDLITAIGAANISTLATQATAAAILAKLSADPATQTSLAAVLAKLSADPATQTTLAAILAKITADPPTQTTLAALLAKITADQPTQTTLALVAAALGVGITYTQVPVCQSVAATLVIAAAASGTLCIHEVSLSNNTAGLLVLKDSDGTVWGTWDLATLGQLVLPFVAARVNGRCLAAGKGLSLTTTTGYVKGYIIYSRL